MAGLLEGARAAYDVLRGKHAGQYLSQGFFGGSWQGFQKNLDASMHDFAEFGPVQTCVNIIAQDLARLPIRHIRVEQDGSHSVVTTSSASRIFRRPNSYQTTSDFMLFLARSLLFRGNAYAVGLRNGNNEISSLWPQPPASVQTFVQPETGEVLYSVAHTDALTLAQPFEETVDPNSLVLDDNMLHVRMHTSRHPLMGESVLSAALYPATAGNAINKNVAAFFSNQAQPSGVLSHPGTGPLRLNEEGMKRMKERFKEIVGGNNIGDIAVLSEGTSWQQLTMSAVDSELVRAYELQERQIFQLFRVPTFLGGDLADVRLNEVEDLMRFYLQSCLAFYIYHFEESFTRLFQLPANEHIEFDLDSNFLVGNLEARIRAISTGVQNLTIKPNEGRKFLKLGAVEGGDTLYGQAQLVEIGTNAMGNDSASTTDTSSEETPDETENEQVELALAPPKEDTASVTDLNEYAMKVSGYE